MTRNTIAALSLFALALAPTLAAAQQGVGLAGSYLAARQAENSSDFASAADYFVRALARDPKNPMLMEQAISALIATGRFERAIPIATKLGADRPDSQVASQVQFADAMMKEDYDRVLSMIAEGRAVGPLVDGLLSAWAQLGKGDVTAAVAAFDAISERPGLAAFGAYHKALALASVGDFEGAEAIFADPASVQLQATRRGVLARAEILSQLERAPDAIDAIRATFPEGQDPQMDSLVVRLQAGETLQFDMVNSPTDGAAEVFQSVAAALSGEAADDYTLLFARTADYLRPGDTDTILLMAGLLEQLGRYELATRVYEQVPRDDPSFPAAELGRAEALRQSGKTDAAIEVLDLLAETRPDIPLVYQTLGDTLRRLERYKEASAAYDRAIALEKEPNDRRQWILYFARGITFERQDRWPEAEADFRKALELSPDQPQVLNYLGYSMVEKGENYDEALSLIQKAVEARPDDGYITDSLGWIYYRLGRYQEAEKEMERAAELTPLDPIINDHLGDVLWAVGRQLEARFQWRRAMSFNPEPEDLARIRRKLEVGLDKVLEEEGAPPLAVANGETK